MTAKGASVTRTRYLRGAIPSRRAIDGTRSPETEMLCVPGGYRHCAWVRRAYQLTVG
jgi:hypothetical protein